MATKPLTSDRDKMHDSRYKFVDSDHDRFVNIDWEFGIKVLLLSHKYDVELSNIESTNHGTALRFRIRGKVSQVDLLNTEVKNELNRQEKI